MWVKSGLAGIIGVGCYFLAVLVPWPENQVGTSASLLVISGFPILGIGGRLIMLGRATSP